MNTNDYHLPYKNGSIKLVLLPEGFIKLSPFTKRFFHRIPGCAELVSRYHTIPVQKCRCCWFGLKNSKKLSLELKLLSCFFFSANRSFMLKRLQLQTKHR